MGVIARDECEMVRRNYSWTNVRRKKAVDTTNKVSKFEAIIFVIKLKIYLTTEAN